MGFYVKHAFPKAMAKKVRMDSNWIRRHLIYLGIKRRDTPKVIKFSDIQNQIPSDFFMLHTSADTIVLGKDTGMLCLGNRIIVETTVHESGFVKVPIQKHKISNADIGLLYKIPTLFQR